MSVAVEPEVAVSLPAEPEGRSAGRLVAGVALAALSALLATWAFPPYGWSFLIWVAWVPMIVAQHVALPSRWSGLGPAIGIGGFVSPRLSGIHRTGLQRATTTCRRSKRREPPSSRAGGAIGTWASSSAITDGEHVIAYFESRGLYAYDMDGKQIWQKDLGDKRMRSQFGEGSTPALHGNRLIVNWDHQGDDFIIAFDKKTGSERWHALADSASYSAPIVIEQAGKHVLVCYTGENVVGLDPSTGKVYWKVPFPPKQMVIGIATPVYHKGMIFVSNFFDGSMLIKLDDKKLAAEKVWYRVGESEKKTDALHSIISTPYLAGDCIYGVDSYGELRCLKLMTGDRVWESDQAVPRERWATIHFVKHGDDVWMFNEKGELIISRLSPKGFKEISRAKLIKPTTPQLPTRRGGVCWAHPAFADRHAFARNDEEIICASLAAE